MARWIELTQGRTMAGTPNKVWINSDQITYFAADNGGSVVHLTGPDPTVAVDESPAQILQRLGAVAQ